MTTCARRLSGMALALGLISGCTKNNGLPGPLIIGMNRSSGNALVCLADKEISRKAQERKWKVVYFDRSEKSLESLNSGQVDIAIAAPPSFFRFALEKPKAAAKLKILAGINSIQNTFSIISNRNARIQEAKDLRQKRLGHLGEYTEFFKNYFFLTEGINETQISQIAFKTTDDVYAALEEGRIDAAIVPDEITKRIDRKKYLPFFSTVHEITSQVIVSEAQLKKNPAVFANFLSSLISAEKELYVDFKQSLERLKDCYPESHDDILNDLLRRRELRVLIDESMRSQYVIYKKWLMSKPEYRAQMPLIRGFEIQDYLEPKLLKKLDFRRVLIK